MKAKLPIVVTDSGKTIEVMAEHPEKARMPIVVRDSGKITEVMLVHPRKAS